MNENDRNLRRKTLGTLFALCPKGQEASEAVDVYLHAMQDIPTPLFIDAIASVAKTLEWPQTPTPGDLRTRAQELMRKQRREQREQRRAKELAEVYQQAMQPAEALQLLEDLKAEGEPETQGAQVAYRLRRHALERVVARDRSLLLDSGNLELKHA